MTGGLGWLVSVWFFWGNEFEENGRGEGHTRSEVGKGFLKAILVKIAQDWCVLFPDLFEGTQDHEQETGIAF